jgi:16S rRNA processing protein RimM
MNRDEFFQAGKVVKLSGSTGELVCSLDTEYFTGKKKLESVFIQINGNLIPFFIDNFQLKGRNQALIKFLDLNSTEEMTPLTNCLIFLPNTLKPKTRKSKNLDVDLTGYNVKDEVHGVIGTVAGILEMPMQELLDIEFDGKQILVPLVDEIVTGIDPQNKTVFIKAPEGLIDLYL